MIKVDWSRRITLFQSIDQTDQQFLLESALSRLLLIDLATCPHFSSPYVRYIFETYFTADAERLQVAQALAFIESLQLDGSEASQVKMLVMLQSGKCASSKSHVLSSLPSLQSDPFSCDPTWSPLSSVKCKPSCMAT